MPKDTKEIRNKKQNYQGWLAFIIIFCHFLLVILSIIPSNLTSEKISDFSNSYSDPIFDQKWAMFAPCPLLENHLKIKYHFEDGSTDWIDPIDKILPIHQKYRFTYHGNIAVGYYNMLYWFKIDLDRLEVIANKKLDFLNLKELRNSLGNRLLSNYIKGYANTEFDKKPKRTDLDISYRNIVTNDTTHYYLLNYK